MERLRAAAGQVCDFDAGVWENDVYVVHTARQDAQPGGFDCVRLSVYRKDGGHVNDWRDLQAIKSQLVGPEAEAIQLYPAESRVTDTLNVAHLWAVPRYRFPYGFTDDRTVVDADPSDTREGRQRPLPPGTADVTPFETFQRRRVEQLTAAAARGYDVHHVLQALKGETQR